MKPNSRNPSKASNERPARRGAPTDRKFPARPSTGRPGGRPAPAGGRPTRPERTDRPARPERSERPARPAREPLDITKLDADLPVDVRYRALRDAAKNAPLKKKQVRDLKRTRRLLLDESGQVEAIEAITPMYEQWRNGNNWQPADDTPAARTATENARAEVVLAGLRALAASGEHRIYRACAGAKGTRIMQSALKHGRHAALELVLECFDETHTFASLLAHQHGQFSALAIFEYCDKTTRRSLLRALGPSVKTFISRPAIARSVDRVYAGAGSLQGYLRECFYRDFFGRRLTEDAPTVGDAANVLASLLATATPSEADTALNRLHQVLMHAVDAGALSSLVMHCWMEFLKVCPVSGLVTEGVNALAPILSEVIDSPHGAALACYVIGLSAPGARKKAARALAAAPGALELAAPAGAAHESAMFCAVLKLLLSTDDAVLLRQSVVEAEATVTEAGEAAVGGGLAADVARLMATPTGQRLILGVLSPFSRNYLRPWQMDMLIESNAAVLPVGRAAVAPAGTNPYATATEHKIVSVQDLLIAEDELNEARRAVQKAEAQWQEQHPGRDLAEIRQTIIQAQTDPNPDTAIEALASDGPLAGIDIASLPRAFNVPGLCKKDLAQRVTAARQLIVPIVVSWLLAEGAEDAAEVATARVASCMEGILPTSILLELVALIHNSDPASIGIDETAAPALAAAIGRAIVREITIGEEQHGLQLEHTSTHAFLRRLVSRVPAIAPLLFAPVAAAASAAVNSKGFLEAGTPAHAVFALRRGAILLADIIVATTSVAPADAPEMLEFVARVIVAGGECAPALRDAIAGTKTTLGVQSPTLIEPVTPVAPARGPAVEAPALSSPVKVVKEAHKDKKDKKEKDKKEKKHKAKK